MNDIGPINQRTAVVAGVIAIIAAGIALFLFGFSLFASLVIGAVIGGIAIIAMLYGWAEPQSDQLNVPAPTAEPAAAPAPKAKAPAAAPKAKAPAAAPKAKAPAAAPKAKAPAAAPKAKAAAATTTTTADADKPQFLSAARDGGPDDLKLIKGVGPKLEKTLHEMGLYHFDQIAKWGPTEQAWINDNLAGFKGRATRDDWVNQAKILADGGETAFSKKK